MKNGRSKAVDAGSFEEIEAAVRETERGRWFLDEYARRKGADAREMLAALRRIEASMGGKPPATDSTMADRLLEAGKSLPAISAEGGRIAAETLMAIEVLDSLSALEPANLATSGSRLALATETKRLKELAEAHRGVYARLQSCASHFENLEAQLIREIVPQLSAEAEAPRATGSFKHFAEDAHLFDPPAPPPPAPPQMPNLKLVTNDKPEPAAEPPAKEAPAFAKGEKRRIVILRGNAQPPMPAADEQPAVTA